MKSILITGAKGFLGSHASKYFKQLGYQVFGLGHGKLEKEESNKIGIDFWKEENVSCKTLLDLNHKFDVIVHCGGSGSVRSSLNNPDEDSRKTVDSTHGVLEYMRYYNPDAFLIYPSSPAVQGEHPNTPISENYVGDPISPYGDNKKITEELCSSYSQKYGLNISIVRLFSVYGKGLRKQLLWDACMKIKTANNNVTFWGTGNETRDFIHINDVLSLFNFMLTLKPKFLIVNGGLGNGYTVRDMVNMIRNIINPKVEINFNQKTDLGNPKYFCADTKKLESLGFNVNKDIKKNIEEYVEWARKIDD